MPRYIYKLFFFRASCFVLNHFSFILVFIQQLMSSFVNSFHFFTSSSFLVMNPFFSSELVFLTLFAYFSKECIHFIYLYQYSVISRKFFFWYLPEDFDTQQQLSLESLSTIKLKVKVIKWILGSRPESFNLLALSVFCIYTPSFFHYKKNTSQLR